MLCSTTGSIRGLIRRFFMDSKDTDGNLGTPQTAKNVYENTVLPIYIITRKNLTSLQI